MARAARTAKRYFKLELAVDERIADEAAGILVANGALGCATLPASRRAGASRAQVRLEAFFTDLSRTRLVRLTETLRRARMIAPRATPLTVERVRDPGWATMWMSRFAPLEVGRRLLVVPPWQRVERPGRVSIVIKPAQAFGTGHHATTAGMLSAIERVCARGAVQRALDVGTGSGILAIAMAMLGAGEVVAIDTDRLAVESARENAALNRVASRINVSATTVNRIRGRFDLIAANIFSATLIALAPELIRRLRPRGMLVMGGVLAREAPAVAARYRRALRCVSVGVDRRWATLVFTR